MHGDECGQKHGEHLRCGLVAAAAAAAHGKTARQPPIGRKLDLVTAGVLAACEAALTWPLRRSVSRLAEETISIGCWQPRRPKTGRGAAG